MVLWFWGFIENRKELTCASSIALAPLDMPAQTQNLPCSIPDIEATAHRPNAPSERKNFVDSSIEKETAKQESNALPAHLSSKHFHDAKPDSRAHKS